jgi:hypothetical protein
MRLCFFLFGFIFSSFGCFGNAIDLLSTDAQVINFITTNIPQYSKTIIQFEKYHHANGNSIDSIPERNWMKCDLGSNGESDLMVFNADGIDLLTIVSENGKFKLIQSVFLWFDSRFIKPEIKKVNGENLVLLFHADGDYDEQRNWLIYSNLVCDTVVYKYGYLLNYLVNPHHYSIEKIETKDDGSCMGCSMKETISIDVNSLQCTCLKTGAYSQTKSYSGQLTVEQMKTIVLLLNYSNFPELNDIGLNNGLPTDQSTTIMTIIYDNGKIKTIKNYGPSGNITIRTIYSIAFNVNWVEIK